MRSVLQSQSIPLFSFRIERALAESHSAFGQLTGSPVNLTAFRRLQNLLLAGLKVVQYAFSHIAVNMQRVQTPWFMPSLRRAINL